MPSPEDVAVLDAGAAEEIAALASGAAVALGPTEAATDWVGTSPSATGAGPVGRKNRYQRPATATARTTIPTSMRIGPRSRVERWAVMGTPGGWARAGRR